MEIMRVILKGTITDHPDDLPEGYIGIEIPCERRDLESMPLVLRELVEEFGFDLTEAETATMGIYKAIFDKAICRNMADAQRVVDAAWRTERLKRYDS